MSSSRRSFLAGGLVLPAAAALHPASASTAPALNYRKLGKTGLKVTTVGFGCMITSDPSVIQRGVDMGINYYDTARVYQSGNCERMVGAALKGRRDKVYLSTKTVAKTKEQALQDIDTSLKELGTDHVDIWYLHSRDAAADINDDLREAQRIAKKAGKIRFAGVSTHTPKAIQAEVLKDGHFDVVLVVYNFMVGTDSDEFLAAMHKANIGVVAMKVMAGGIKDPEGTPKARGIMKRNGAPLAALKWILKNPRIATTIPSMTDNEQLEENMLAMSVKFQESDGQVLAARAEQINDSYCRMCNACEGQCPQGLPVREVLRSVMYAQGYGQFQLGREHFRTLDAQAQAVRCGDCSECAVKCPNGVAIARRAELAQTWFA